jgi:head-tail adaptor
MDDYELDRIASNNPALTAPAAQRASIYRHRSRGRKHAATSGFENSQGTATSAELSKYDVSIFVSYRRQLPN